MGDETPRRKVAHHFRNLVLDGAADETDGGPTSGGGALPGQPLRAADAPPAEALQHINENPDAVMEDAKLEIFEKEMFKDNTEGTADEASTSQPPEDTLMEPTPVPPNPRRTKKRGKSSAAATTTKRTTKKAKQKPKKKPPVEEDSDSSDREIVDPVRAALTWQEEEITVYDPDDEDDDGEGMDGVGFQPPPKIARATARRKLGQLAGYRRMVEQEARERRRRRRGRRESEGDGEGKRGSRVKFVEGETIIEVV